eukprot:TRINITY_DN15418_c0_g2_i2.p1 TRINITY_DN15418_c0_g2~~TRINITY_DN15418_c0_g2_i2.p1  ORF type:complete len:416 (-),score=44.14 TRINITY_DN15418_c0_g2_i2:90-1271(-)
MTARPGDCESGLNSAASSQLCMGARVSLKGLVAAPELNGCQGRLEAYDDEKGRWTVVLDAGGAQKSVRPCNVELLQADSSGSKNRSRSRSRSGTRACDKQDRAQSTAANAAGNAQRKPIGSNGSSDAKSPANDKSFRSGQFEANLSKLREKAASEQSRNTSGKRRHEAGDVDNDAKRDNGSGSDGWRRQKDQFSEAVLNKPLTFVPQAEVDVSCKKVTVVDPKAEERRKRGEVSDDDDDDIPEVGKIKVPRPVIPVATSTWKPEPQQQQSWPQEWPSEATAPDAASDFAPAVSSSANQWTSAADTDFAGSSSKGRFKLSVSQAAQKVDKAHEDLRAKKAAILEKKKVMLSKLTRQLQDCLGKLQDDSLDDASREKYQDFITTLKTQMTALSES